MVGKFSKKAVIVGGLASLVWAGSAYAWFRMPAWVSKPVSQVVNTVSNIVQAVVAPVTSVVPTAAVAPASPAGGLIQGVSNLGAAIVEPVVNGVIQVATTVVTPAIRPIAPDLSIPVNTLNANAYLSFAPLVQDAFSLVSAQVTPMGNAAAADDEGFKFLLPVTRIALKVDKPTAGDATGSALDIWRIAPRRTPNEGQRVGIKLANFQIDFKAGVVIADVKTYPLGGASTRTAIYSFRQATDLALKYQFPLSITGKQTLDELRATPEIKEMFGTGLQLRSFEVAALDVIDSYGQIDVDVAVSFRKKAVSSVPFKLD